MKYISFNPNNTTAKLALSLLVMMLASGAVSALWGYKMGHDALKGVSQPDINLAKKRAGNSKTVASPSDFVPIDEKTILTQVYNRINSKAEKTDKAATQKEQEKKEQKQSSTSEPQKSKLAQKIDLKVNFPLKTSDRGVTFEVLKASQQGGSLLLDVNLINKGADAVQFLYSFLEVKDKQGRSLSAMTEGLPGEIPANGEKFSGTVKIPLELIDEQQPISLNLTDYPEQKLKLNVVDIPVVR